jgi:hypothetical protein
MRGAPNDLSSTTLRPLGPSVTLTALLRMSTPRNILSRASTENFTSLAAISVSPEYELCFPCRHRRIFAAISIEPATATPLYRDGRNDVRP